MWFNAVWGTRLWVSSFPTSLSSWSSARSPSLATWRRRDSSFHVFSLCLTLPYLKSWARLQILTLFRYVGNTGCIAVITNVLHRQAHLLGIFDNVKSVVFHEKEYDRIIAISSREEETIPLEQPVLAQGNVEAWLGQLLQGAMDSLHAVIRDAFVAIQNPSFDLLGFLNSFPAQVFFFLSHTIACRWCVAMCAPGGTTWNPDDLDEGCRECSSECSLQ